MTNREIGSMVSLLTAALLSGAEITAPEFDDAKVMVQKGVRKALKAQGKTIVETEGGYQAVDAAPKKASKPRAKAPVMQDDDFGVTFTAPEPLVELESEEDLDAALATSLVAGPTVKRVYTKADDMVTQAFAELRKIRVGALRVTFAKNCSVKDYSGFPEWLEKNAAKYAGAVLTRVGKGFEGKAYVLAPNDEFCNQIKSLVATALPNLEILTERVG